ncbi:MAG: thioredoxin family protein [Prolixibacteraceae bacterium]|jgi:thiol:disulfide interchange protein DsbD|nr:thioredoxin family protein [Prolixibacteraceae bacterium]
MIAKRIFLFALLLAAFQMVSAQILEPVKWSFDSKKTGDSEYELRFIATMDNGWHLYSQFVPSGGPIPTSFKFDKLSGFILVGKVVEPKPLEENDPNFNMVVKYFTKSVVFTQKVKVISDKHVEVKGFLEFMCCNNQNCLPPTEVNYSFKLEGVKTAGVVSQDTAKALSTVPVITVKDTAAPAFQIVQPLVAAAKAAIKPVASNDDFTGKDRTLLWFFLQAFLWGLLAILTPCVFPMIPMTVSYFMKSGAKGKVQAMVYGLSIIAIYVIFGVLVSVLFGADFGNWLSTHWLPNVLFFLIFVVFAASFFGYFEITVPSWMINKSVQQEDKGGFVGTIFMAFTLVLVSFSCTGPIVGTVLVQAVGGQILKPVIGMLGFSLAFAIPFTLFAFFPQWLKQMPKSGGWLNTIKVVIGFIELAFALKFLNVPDQTYHWGILDREVYLSFWIVIFTMMGFYLLGKIKFPHDSDYPVVRSFPRLMIIIFTFTFVMYLIPGLWGAPLKAISGWLPPMESQDFDINAIARENGGSGGGIKAAGNVSEAPRYADVLKLPHGLSGYFDYDQALRVSKALKKPVFVDFTGHGCTNCREMENRVWSDQGVLSRLRENFVLVALYVDDKVIEMPKEEWYTSKSGREVKLLGKKNADLQTSQFGTNSQPYYVILDSDGKLLVSPKAYDLNVENFKKFLDAGSEEFKKLK